MIGVKPVTFSLTYTLIELPALIAAVLAGHADITPLLLPKDVSTHVLVSCRDEKTNGFVSAPDKHSTRLRRCQQEISLDLLTP